MLSKLRNSGSKPACPRERPLSSDAQRTVNHSLRSLVTRGKREIFYLGESSREALADRLLTEDVQDVRLTVYLDSWITSEARQLKITFPFPTSVHNKRATPVLYTICVDQFDVVTEVLGSLV